MIPYHITRTETGTDIEPHGGVCIDDAIRFAVKQAKTTPNVTLTWCCDIHLRINNKTFGDIYSEWTQAMHAPPSAKQRAEIERSQRMYDEEVQRSRTLRAALVGHEFTDAMREGHGYTRDNTAMLEIEDAIRAGVDWFEKYSDVNATNINRIQLEDLEAHIARYFVTASGGAFERALRYAIYARTYGWDKFAERWSE